MKMLKRLLDLFRKKRYITTRREDVFIEDDKNKVEEDINKIREQINNVVRKRMEIRVFKEILQDSDKHYSLNEINYLYNSIMKENKEKML